MPNVKPALISTEVHFKVRIGSPDGSLVYENEIPLRYENTGGGEVDGRLTMTMELTPVSQRKLEAIAALADALRLHEVSL